ncbi:putative multi-domain containing protein, partial [Aduncisulcus paluster]
AGRIISAGSNFLSELVELQRLFPVPLSDLAGLRVPARSSMLAGSAEILGRIRLLRRAVRWYAWRARVLGGNLAARTLQPPQSHTPIPEPAELSPTSSGIGSALAEQLAQQGHSLILVARREDRLRVLATRLADAHSVTVEVRACDLADRAARAGLLRQVELNSVAVHELTLAVLPGMLARAAGAIVITGSTAGNQPGPGNATYAASKAFANTFAESLHGELRGTGVTCTLLAPGPVYTEFSEVAELSNLDRLLPDPLWVSAEKAAAVAISGASKGKRRVVPGAFAKVQTVGGQMMDWEPVIRTEGRSVTGDIRRMFDLADPRRTLYRDAHYFAATVEVDPGRMRQWLPAGVRLANPARADVFTAFFPDCNYGSVYHEAGVFVHIKVRGRTGIHCPWMILDDDVALILGRELLG